MKHATIIAHMPRIESLRALIQGPAPYACACGLLLLDYVPERRVGAVAHGLLVCYREGESNDAFRRVQGSIEP